MKKIQEVFLKSNDSSPFVELPKHSEIISVRMDENDQPIVSYIFDLTVGDQIEKRDFIVARNHDILDGNLSLNNFIGLIVNSLGQVRYVFEKKQS